VLVRLSFIVFLIPSLLIGQQRRYEIPAEWSDRIVPGKIVVKIRTEPSGKNQRVNPFEIDKVPGILGSEPFRKSKTNARQTPSVLDGIFWVTVDPSLDLVTICNQLLDYEEVVYAEVLLNEELLFTPNDPSAQPGTGNQGYLDVINAYEAWDITTGNPNIVIGVVDTGMDLAHQDLSSKYYIHTGEAPEANGIDDDGNGYIDDIMGYDFADDDANAQADGSQHGTHVGGIAGAATNNGIGIAGVGYQTKLAPLKGFTTVGTVSTGVWEAVYYGAENGFDILNLSFGSAGTYNQFLQDLINYCVLEKDVVVVAAAGNTNADLDFYPASYENVLSVAGTTLTDTKWSSGTYSHHVDMTAPALSIYSTQNNNTYNADNGSSHATPQVAGAAALVKSVFTQYNARQIMEQLRVTSDDIYSVSGNSAYAYKLGKGRLNVFRAVTESTSRSLRLADFTYDNGFGTYAFYGDTLRLSFDLINYLAGVNNPTISLVSESPYATVLTNAWQPGAFQTMESKRADAINILIAEDAPPNTEINLRFMMEEGSYSDFQNISFRTNPNYLDVGNDNLALRIGGDGSLCFTDAAYTSGYQMEYKNELVMKYAGLLVATDASNVQDNVVKTLTGAITRDADFSTEKNVKMIPHEIAPFVGYSEFSSVTDDFMVEQSVVQDTDDVLLLSYRIVNTSGAVLPQLHVGLFADYTLGTMADNQASWDENIQALVFHNGSEQVFAALKLMGDTYHFAALDMQAANGNTRDVGDTFSDTDKFALMTTADMPEAGFAGGGNDVAGLVSRSFEGVQPGEAVHLAVVLALSDSYAGLVANLEKADQLYDDFLAYPPVLETVYSCEGADLLVNPSKGTSYSFYTDAAATEFLSTSEALLVTDILQDSVIYVKNLDGTYPSAVQTIKINVLNEIGRFSASKDTLYLDHPTVNTISFTDESFRANEWQWDFGNGRQATVANPTVNYAQAGTYTVTLTVGSAIGCDDVVTKEIVVAERPASPTLQDVFICGNETIELIHPSEKYVVYYENGQLIAKAETVELGPFDASTTLFIAHLVDGFESLPTEVTVTVDPLKADFEVAPDLSSAETRALFSYTGNGATSFAWAVNDVEMGEMSTLSIPVDDAAFDLTFTVVNDNCTDTKTETIHFSPSLPPTLSPVSVCSGESATLIPGNGTYFGFYADAELSQLISKSEQLTLEEVTQDQTVYVVGLDGVLPSSPVMATITIADFSTEIIATPPSLILAQSQVVTLTSNEEITSAAWYVDDELIETALSPTVLFTTPGTFEIKLIATNAAGCTWEATLLYEVIASVTDAIAQDLTIYPNPVRRGQTLRTPARVNGLKLYNLTGNLVASVQLGNELYVPNDLVPGVYILSLQSGESTQSIKLLIQ